MCWIAQQSPVREPEKGEGAGAGVFAASDNVEDLRREGGVFYGRRWP